MNARSYRRPVPPALKALNITKEFPGVLANDNVSIDVHKGEVLALLGENGAGKSTLVNILYGLYKADSGEIRLNGETVVFNNPRDAINHRIGMVHQHFQLVTPLSVAENVVLGNEPVTSTRLLAMREAESKVRELSEHLGLPVEPRSLVEDLPVGIQQRVEIVRTLYRDVDILILDEPTAVLSPQETDEFLEILRDLAAKGVAIIFITHKLREVLAVSDRVSVLRRGKVVGTLPTAETTEESLAEMMVGRDVMLQVDKTPAQPKHPVLEVFGLRAEDDRGQQALKGIDFQVRGGEILGVAGVQGNGQRELVEAIVGLRKCTGGAVSMEGNNLTHSSVRKRRDAGMAHIPEDRETHGVVGDYSVSENLVLNRFWRKPFSEAGFQNFKSIKQQAEELVQGFDIRTPDIHTSAGTLSGGNKQKVVVAREMSGNVRLLVAAGPTRGIDVGSIEFIHNQIIRQRDEGVAVLLVSAELDEVLSLSDRVAVIYEGQFMDTLSIEEATREKIGLLMAGIKR